MTEPAAYGVDLDQLDAATRALGACGATYDDVLDDVRSRVAALHLTWDGLAARAHGAAQEDWESGFAAMREALGVMRAAAAGAHGHYSSAVASNLEMWGRL